VEVRSSDNLAPPLGPGQTNEPATSANIIGLNPNTKFSGSGNLVANNGGDGVVVSENPFPNNATPISNSGNSILGNSIFANGGIGIDLVPAASSPSPEKPNDLLGAPTITTVTLGASSTLVQGTVNLPARAGMALRIELFSSPACDASGFGEGQTFIGFANTATDASGNASFSATASPVSPGQSLTATATNTSADPSAQPGSVNIFNTSEFSRCFAVPPAPATSGPQAAPPSNAFTVISKSIKRGVVTLKVQTHAPGAIRASATFVQTVKKSTGHGRHRHRHAVRQTILYGQVGTPTNGVTRAILTIAPTGRAASLLKRLRTLRLSINVSFTPTGGRINTIVFPLTVSSPKPKPRHHHR
jgi:hypothetical protein